MLAYGTLTLKAAWDIDLLVPAASVEAAGALLAAEGYEWIERSGGDSRKAARFHLFAKETIWRHPRTGLVVELHTRLADNVRLLAEVTAHGSRQRVTLGSAGRADTLEDHTLFVYLCVHGAASGWSRLKWLADLAALTKAAPRDQVAAWYRSASAHYAAPAAAQALILMNQVLAVPVPSDLLAEALETRAATRDALRAFRLMRHTGARELSDVPFGPQALRLAQFGLAEGLRFNVAEARRQLVNPWDRAFGPLPQYLHILYPLLRLPDWLARNGKQAWRASCRRQTDRQA